MQPHERGESPEVRVAYDVVPRIEKIENVVRALHELIQYLDGGGALDTVSREKLKRDLDQYSNISDTMKKLGGLLKQSESQGEI